MRSCCCCIHTSVRLSAAANQFATIRALAARQPSRGGIPSGEGHHLSINMHQQRPPTTAAGACTVHASAVLRSSVPLYMTAPQQLPTTTQNHHNQLGIACYTRANLSPNYIQQRWQPAPPAPPLTLLEHQPSHCTRRNGNNPTRCCLTLQPAHCLVDSTRGGSPGRGSVALRPPEASTAQQARHKATPAWRLVLSKPARYRAAPNVEHSRTRHSAWRRAAWPRTGVELLAARLVHVLHRLDLCLRELALLVALGALAFQQRLAVLVHLQLGDDHLGGVDANVDRGACGAAQSG